MTDVFNSSDGTNIFGENNSDGGDTKDLENEITNIKTRVSILEGDETLINGQNGQIKINTDSIVANKNLITTNQNNVNSALFEISNNKLLYTDQNTNKIQTNRDNILSNTNTINQHKTKIIQNETNITANLNEINVLKSHNSSHPDGTSLQGQIDTLNNKAVIKNTRLDYKGKHIVFDKTILELTRKTENKINIYPDAFFSNSSFVSTGYINDGPTLNNIDGSVLFDKIIYNDNDNQDSRVTFVNYDHATGQYKLFGDEASGIKHLSTHYNENGTISTIESWGDYVQFKFTKKYEITDIILISSVYAKGPPITYTIVASNDEQNWVYIKTEANYTTTSKFNNIGEYRTYLSGLGLTTDFTNWGHPNNLLNHTTGFPVNLKKEGFFYYRIIIFKFPPNSSLNHDLTEIQLFGYEVDGIDLGDISRIKTHILGLDGDNNSDFNNSIITQNKTNIATNLTKINQNETNITTLQTDVNVLKTTSNTNIEGLSYDSQNNNRLTINAWRGYFSSDLEALNLTINPSSGTRKYYFFNALENFTLTTDGSYPKIEILSTTKDVKISSDKFITDNGYFKNVYINDELFDLAKIQTDITNLKNNSSNNNLTDIENDNTLDLNGEVNFKYFSNEFTNVKPIDVDVSNYSDLKTLFGVAYETNPKIMLLDNKVSLDDRWLLRDSNNQNLYQSQGDVYLGSQSTNGTSGEWFILSYAYDVNITQFSIIYRDEQLNSVVSELSVFGSNDNTNWTFIEKFTMSTSTKDGDNRDYYQTASTLDEYRNKLLNITTSITLWEGSKTFQNLRLNNANEYKHYKFVIENIEASDFTVLSEIETWGHKKKDLLFRDAYNKFTNDIQQNLNQISQLGTKIDQDVKSTSNVNFNEMTVLNTVRFNNNVNQTQYSIRNDAGNLKITSDNNPLIEFQENNNNTLRIASDNLVVTGFAKIENEMYIKNGYNDSVMWYSNKFVIRNETPGASVPYKDMLVMNNNQMTLNLNEMVLNGGNVKIQNGLVYLNSGAYSHTIGMDLNSFDFRAKGNSIYGGMRFFTGDGNVLAMRMNGEGKTMIGDIEGNGRLNVQDLTGSFIDFRVGNASAGEIKYDVSTSGLTIESSNVLFNSNVSLPSTKDIVIGGVAVKNSISTIKNKLEILSDVPTLYKDTSGNNLISRNFINLPSTLNQTNFTISFRYKRTGDRELSSLFRLGNDVPSVDCFLQNDNTIIINNYITFFLSNNNLNVEHHIVFTINNNTINVYHDGENVVRNGFINSMPANLNHLMIGNTRTYLPGGATNLEFIGEINNVRIFNNTLSTNQIKELIYEDFRNLRMDNLDVLNLGSGTIKKSTEKAGLEINTINQNHSLFFNCEFTINNVYNDCVLWSKNSFIFRLGEIGNPANNQVLYINTDEAIFNTNLKIKGKRISCDTTRDLIYFETNEIVFGNPTNNNKWGFKSGTNGIEVFQNNNFIGNVAIDSGGGGGSSGNWYDPYNPVNTGGALFSDDRLKYNESDIKDALTSINELKIQNYKMTSKLMNDEEEKRKEQTKDKNRLKTGIIAQDLLKIPSLKHCVIEPNNPETEPYKVDYFSLFTYSMQAIQELSMKINELEKKIN